MSYIAGLTLAVMLTPCQYDSSSKPIQSAAPYGLQQAGKQIPVNNKISPLTYWLKSVENAGFSGVGTATKC